MYKITNLEQHLTRRGCYFSCDLMRGDTKVGDIENKGDGGCTWIYFSHKVAQADYERAVAMNGTCKSGDYIEELITAYEATN